MLKKLPVTESFRDVTGRSNCRGQDGVSLWSSMSVNDQLTFWVSLQMVYLTQWREIQFCPQYHYKKRFLLSLCLLCVLIISLVLTYLISDEKVSLVKL